MVQEFLDIGLLGAVDPDVVIELRLRDIDDEMEACLLATLSYLVQIEYMSLLLKKHLLT